MAPYLALKSRYTGAVVLVLVGSLVLLELFYFQFHTYFQQMAVMEVLPEVVEGTSPVEVERARGTFGEVDAIHKGSGVAKILERGSESFLVFEDFEVTNGPDLYVYLTTAENPTGDLASLGDYIDLGLLKGNVGNQNYRLPSGSEAHKTVVIWCKKFGVLFSFAAMK